MKPALRFSFLLSQLVTLTFLIFISARIIIQHFSAPSIKADSTLNVFFKDIENEKIQKNFLNVLNSYKTLHPYKITLTKRLLESTTMQAQPEFSLNSLFGGARTYEIKLSQYVRHSNKITVADLPEDVLTGWFAHELGHLVDYENYNGMEMLWYGTKYLLFEKFKKSAEHRADWVAINTGFVNEIIAAKMYILESEYLDEKYKNQIKKYYLPIEDIETYLKK
ncbi:MAG: hypothetical protein ACJA0X_002657 [Cyclobacteriaceae bacterium]